MNCVTSCVVSAGLSGNDGLSTGTSEASIVCNVFCDAFCKAYCGNEGRSSSPGGRVGGFFVRSFCIGSNLWKESIRDLGMVEVEVQALVGGPGGVRPANMAALI